LSKKCHVVVVQLRLLDESELLLEKELLEFISPRVKREL